MPVNKVPQRKEKKFVFHCSLFFLLFTASWSHAQKWVSMMHDPHVNFHDVQKEFNAYWKNRTLTRGYGYKQFKRWEYLMQSRVDKNGRLPDAGYIQEQLRQYQLNHGAVKQSSPAKWTAVGPQSAAGLEGGIGRVQCFAMDPDTKTNYWAGTPGGGLWKSTDAGATWTPETDHFVSLGISWILVHPGNPAIMYVSTGDPDGAVAQSTGVLKSTDGGDTWTQSGLSFTTGQKKQINQLRFFPGNPEVLFAASSDGIYRSTDSGASWILVHPGGRIFDIEFHPSTPATMYASGYGKLFRSTDSGITWTLLESGLPPAGDKSLVAVTAQAPDNVYYLTTASNTVSGMYTSLNQGEHFSASDSYPFVGAQAWWDLVLEVNPADRNQIFVGGISFNNSRDGGNTWGGYFNGLHADHHNMYFFGDTWFVCNDGGLYRSTDNGSTWELLHQGMEIMQFYRMSAYVHDAGFLLGGAQDNGTSLHHNNTWKQVMDADGMDNAISGYDREVLWLSIQNGYLYKSTDGGISLERVNGNIDEQGGWVTPFILNPGNHDSVLTGFRNIWKSSVGGRTWTRISNFSSGAVDKILLNWKTPDVIYATSSGLLRKTMDGGNNWITVSAPGLEASAFRAVAIDPENSDRIWVAASGLNAGKRVFYSSDGGITWTNVSGTLPDVPMLCMEYLPGSNDGIYIGSDVGVFYKDASMGDWEFYNEGLPHVRIEDIDFNPGTAKIRVATYGRGIWESPLHEDAAGKPLADFDASPKAACIGTTVTFRDYSYKAASWNWSFPGGTPSASTNQHPVVTYHSNGSFPVTLTVSNGNGTSTKTRPGMVLISGNLVNTYPYELNADNLNVGDTVNLGGWTNGTDDQRNWFVHEGPAPAYIQKAGPKSDHTTGYGKYLLYESNAGASRWANLYSPCFDMSGISNPVLEYYEYVFGFDKDGELHLDVQVDGFWHLDIIAADSQMGNMWLKKTVDLSSYGGKMVRLRFRARSSWMAKDFALDDIRIRPKQFTSPAADFIATVTVGLPGLTTKFYDQSVHLPASYKWSFPGGTPDKSTEANPVVTYQAAGEHTVSLTVSNSLGSDSITKTAYIKVSHVIYNMSNKTVTDCVGRLFDSGGDAGSYDNNEQYYFTISPPGAQLLKLKFSDWALATPDGISIYDGASSAGLLIGIYTGNNKPPEITASSGAVTLVFISNHMTVNSGFKMEWEAIGGSTCSPDSKVLPPVARFGSPLTSGDLPLEVELNDSSLNAPLAWTWLLNGSNTYHQYGKNIKAMYEMPGMYDVSLIVVNEGGRDTLTRTNFVTVTEPPAEINMHTGSVTACKGTLYDDGGPDSDYMNGETHVLVLEPFGATHITMDFLEWDMEDKDTLRVYDGASVSDPLLGTWSETGPGTVIANSGSMTLQFISDGDMTAAGWKAAWRAMGGICPPWVSVDERKEEREVMLFPNPTEGVITVKMHVAYEHLIVRDITGQIVQRQRITGRNVKMDLTNRASGIYFVQLIGAAGVWVQKLVVR